MECSQIRAILFENMDTEIPAEFREAVEAHLAVCRSCSMQLEALREQSNALGSLPKVAAPGDFLEQVRSRVEKPSVLSRLRQGLTGLFARKHFFQLAGAAATAVVVIAAAQVILRDGGQKTLRSSAPPSVESPGSAAPAPSARAPRVSPAPPVPPMGEPHRLAGVETQSVTLTVKLPAASVKVKTRGGSFRPESLSPPSASATRPGARDDRSLKRDVSKGFGGSAEVSEGSPPSETRQISSDVIRLIKRANGRVLSAGPPRDENQRETLLAEMPAANYHSFLDQLRRLGDVELSGDKEFSPAADSKVRVSVSFDTRD